MRALRISLLLAGFAVTAVAQLNPTVKVLQRPTTAVPSECVDGLAPQPQQAERVTPEERPIIRDTSRDMQPPPSSTLRSELQNAVEAAQQNSRDAFRESLQRAKALLASYPPGGERTSATELVNALDDVDKVWEYQFSSPTGAFFDTASEPYRIASKYPGYEAYVRRQIVVDQNGNKFYPSHETRDFLIAEGGQRLSRVTGRAAPPRPITSRPTVVPTPTTPRPTVRTTGVTTTTPPKPKPRPVRSTAPRVTRHATPSTAPKPRPKPPVVVARKSTPPPPPVKAASVEPTPVPTPPPVVATPTATETTASMPAPTTSETTATTTTVATTTEPMTETTETTASTTTAGKPASSRSFFGPLLLIIVGVGVLVMLWRASS